MQLITVIAIVCAAVVITVVFSRIYYTRKAEKKILYMLESLSDGEMNFRFKESKRKNSLNNLLNRLKSHFDTGVKNVIEDKEVESWTRLIRVLTHEIMNTVSPISSLSEALKDAPESAMREGLNTISASSKGLIEFVQSYRDLTRIQKPVKKALLLKELVGRVLHLEQEPAAAAGVKMTYTEKSEDILLYADENQISRILINLIRNAIQAGATKVDIVSEIASDESVKVYVSNNGPAISEEAQEQIFVPFYTTKEEGSGIGLSVSRQIMRLHGGNLSLLQSGADATTFLLTFK
ncbi:MAG: HAMP domain-containing histidine kinase [Bacteroidales bacterium]|nr:HAMP domain-containing histidine kinase [Bacteroidales bacterium]MDT3356165.1 HAMP domain-containing histidine kinase [Bacteroidota bacterium]